MKDLIVGAVACVLIFYFLASIEWVEVVFGWTREHEDWEIDEVIAAVPAFALATASFSTRRWREVTRLNRQLEETVARLEEAIAQRISMEEQLGEAYKMAAMGTLAGGLARELNNVLQPVLTLAQLGAERDDIATESKTKFQHILSAAERGREILKSTMGFPTGGTREMHEIMPFEDIADFIGNTMEFYSDDLDIESRLSEDAGRILVNRSEFHQVITNLLTNAADALDHEGRILVGLESCLLDADAARAQGLKGGNYFRLTVSDDGPGMSSDVKSQVFEPFFTTKGSSSTGLGLATVYSLVQGWDGKISVDSSPGNGATFRILIPKSES